MIAPVTRVSCLTNEKVTIPAGLCLEPVPVFATMILTVFLAKAMPIHEGMPGGIQ